MKNLIQFIPKDKNGNKIQIKKSHEGKFTEYCGGKVTSECILRGKSSLDPALRKLAIFAENARKWKHRKGGILKGGSGLANLLSKPIKMDSGLFTTDDDGKIIPIQVDSGLTVGSTINTMAKGTLDGVSEFIGTMNGSNVSSRAADDRLKLIDARLAATKNTMNGGNAVEQASKVGQIQEDIDNRKKLEYVNGIKLGLESALSTMEAGIKEANMKQTALYKGLALGGKSYELIASELLPNAEPDLPGESTAKTEQEMLDLFMKNNPTANREQVILYILKTHSDPNKLSPSLLSVFSMKLGGAFKNPYILKHLIMSYE